MPAQKHPSQNSAGDDTKDTTYSDPSAAIFSMYIAGASDFDDKLVGEWKGGAENALIFTGVFSSTVATFISMSYPKLQPDPNDTIQSLLAQISQQLATPNGTIIPPASLSDQGSFTPSASVVFVNSLWFLSLVLSLISALLASFLQQWARRYLMLVQRNREPHVRAHVQEYFSKGTRKFRVFAVVEALPFLLFVSLLLFFAGLVVFASLANDSVAIITFGIIGICFFYYLGFTQMSLRYPDCPYYTPFTSLMWYSAQMIQLFYVSVLYYGAKGLHDYGRAVNQNTVKSFRDRHQSEAKTFAGGMISRLENSAKLISMDIYQSTLIRTLDWLKEDHELEEFVTGIPGLCESKALATHKNDGTQRTIRDVLAALPGPMGFHASESLPWSIIQLAQRALTSKLPKSVQQQRTRACLKALCYIPGAIRDLLATYAAGEHYCLELLPLLNSPESLEIINELWDTPDDDVALSVRCTAAVVAAFMITPPRRSLNNFVTSAIPFIWKDEVGKQFLSKRLGISANLQSDSARLQNLVCFLLDITDKLGHMNALQWTSDYEDRIRSERRELFDTRHTEEYRIGRGTFDQRGYRESRAFVPAAQQDLITLTLEILARPVRKVAAQNGPPVIVADAIANAGASQRDAFRDALLKLVQVGFSQAGEWALEQAQTQVPPESMLRTQARIQAQATDDFEVIKDALEPVLRSLGLTVEMRIPIRHVQVIP
ncbi:hypothetical protein EDB92DRAFT_685347 [Lactarius akahatsu]|uniref:DUF6535 domain-containing protein n=1 Tax=Lactarius akahatsu TaxID=416441 RepID=A0AAD4LHM7_9AGAM|nr:hypothetical protein EDB92DRAFT_685347 [Lactarius akahatsu]